jgi:methionyl-tRNA formyltransferase
MNYVFFGTPDFSAHCLELLLEHGFVPRAVVVNPDRPTGRKKIVTPPPVKIAAEQWNEARGGRREEPLDPARGKQGTRIEILQPEKLDAEFVEKLKSFDADFFLVFAYNKIFRKNILEIPRLGIVGIHPSFLPNYRGSSPFQTALLDGATETGVTLYLLDEGVDSGSIIAASEPVEITEADSAHPLGMKLAKVGAELAIATLPHFVSGEITPQPQDETRATFTRKFKTEDGFVEPADLAAAEKGDAEKSAAILNKIRAFTPEPGAWTMRDNKRLKLLAATIENGVLRLTRTQEEGRRPIETKRIGVGPR